MPDPTPRTPPEAGPAGGARLSRGDASPAVVLFLVTEDWYFCSHRLPIARAARAAGARVIVATRVDAHGALIEREGFGLVSLPWRRRSTNPLREVRAFISICRLYRRERPDVVHHVAIKPVVYGGLAARCAGVPNQVNAIAGLGYLETSRQLRARLLRPVFRAVLRIAWRGGGAHAIVQNPDDAAALVSSGLLEAGRVHAIRGSGVDVERFAPAPEAPGRVNVTFAGRLLWSKGIGELVEAARLLRARGVDLDIHLVGEPDRENPESVPDAALRGWVAEGTVVSHPWSDDMPAVWRAAHVAVLPSYREGLPKSLLEAAASARALVATDVPGCREIARDGVNALLVPARDAGALAGAIERLALDPSLRRRFGAAGREIVEREFAESIVVARTLDLYRRVIGARGGNW